MTSSSTPTWQTVKVLFSARDTRCMANRGYQLDDYQAVKAEAEAIYRSVESESMPPSKPWTTEQVAMFRQWIDAGCLEGAAGPDPGPPDGLPTPDDERRAFHLLVNIESNRDFESTAQRWARAYLAAAKFDADELYAPFEYTVAAFRQRIQKIYDDQLVYMHRPHPYDQRLFRWSNGNDYPIGPFTDAVVKDRLLQLAPFNLTDGSWLQRAVSAGPIDEVSAHLFDIWADEAGNGNIEENHSNVYDNLLKSCGIYLPPVKAADFIDIDVLPSSWRTPVFELCVGLFPEEFFPELLGMTLLLEWEATPQMLPMVRLLEGRGINPLFYRLHMAIDNISSGHGALARQAIERYLADRLEDGGQVSMQQHWQRIWRGYVTWATLGSGGEDRVERALQIQRKQINIGTKAEPKCWPDLKEHARQRMLKMVQRKASAARQVHGSKSIGGRLLNSLFDDPEQLLAALVSAGYIDSERPSASRFFDLTAFGAPMYHVFNEDELAIVSDWIESLSDHPACVDPIDPDSGDAGAAARMAALVEQLAPTASQAHDGIELSVGGQTVELKSLFSQPVTLIAALVSNGWVVPGDPARSMFYTRVLGNGGPMDGVLTADQMDVVKAWIAAGAAAPSQVVAGFTAKRARGGAPPGSELAWRRPYIGQGGVH